MPSQPDTHLPLRFWVIALIALINSISFTIIIPVVYAYSKQFGLSDFEASLLPTTYALSQFIGTPILGRLSDRLGRKPLLILSLMGTVLANLTAGTASVAWLLFAARGFDGLTGGNTSIARAIISDTTSPGQRAKAFGIFDATFRLGFVAGPSLSYVAQQLPPLPGVTSLGMSFIISAGIALLATLLCWIVLPETLPEKQSFRLKWSDFSFSLLMRSVTGPNFNRIFLLTFLSGSTYTIFTFAFQPFFLNTLGQGAPQLAIVFAAIGILGFTSQVFGIDPLRRRFSLVKILAVALFLRGVVFLLIPAVPILPAFVVFVALFGIVNSFPLPMINTILSLQSKPKEQGEVLGINASYLSLSNAVGPAISGLLVSVDYKTPFWVTGVLTLLTSWFAFGLQPTYAKTNGASPPERRS